MNFNSLLKDTNCACLLDTIQDNDHFFARKINKPMAMDKDFTSHWERGKRASACKEVCGYKGLSINLWDENNKDAIIEKFLTTFSITPKHKDCIFVMRFLPQAGVIKQTPSKNDMTHCDFYKSDEFSLDLRVCFKI
jgi:hypothetical protein